MLTDTRLAQFRQQLEAERARIRGTIGNLGEEVEQLGAYEETERGTLSNDPADVGTEVYEQERALTLERGEQELLQQVEAALVRLDAGAYGRCVRCGREIPVERLEALPYAALCIACQSEVERGSSRPARRPS